MSELDPHGIEPGENWPHSVLVYGWPCQNRKHRKLRAARILRNARWGEWSCWQCGLPVPFTKRADATYCRESCRKKAARRRRDCRKTKVA